MTTEQKVKSNDPEPTCCGCIPIETGVKIMVFFAILSFIGNILNGIASIDTYGGFTLDISYFFIAIPEGIVIYYYSKVR